MRLMALRSTAQAAVADGSRWEPMGAAGLNGPRGEPSSVRGLGRSGLSSQLTGGASVVHAQVLLEVA